MADEDDRRDVRSGAEGAVPDEEETVTSAEETADDESDESTEDGDGKKKKKKQGSFWKELPILIVVAVVLALVIKAFAVQAFYIPSGSMENTLKIGDRVLVNKIVYHIHDVRRGDVVVFNGLDSWDPETHISKPTNPFSKALRAVGTAFGVAPNEKDYIKRVIGVPGDHIHCCDAQGRVTVTDSHGVVRTLDEKSYLYTDPVTHEQNKPSNEPFDAYVKKGQLWVMGDHRELSYDSRSHRGDPGGGTIPTDRVIGRAFVIVWPLNRISTLSTPDTFHQQGHKAVSLAAPATPMTLGVLGTLPIAYLRRRKHRRK